MKVYISGPITKDPNYLSKFKDAEVILKEAGYTVLNPVIWSNTPLTYDEYMQLDLAMLAICEKMFLLPGYKNSKGCQIEIEYAKAHQIPMEELCLTTT